MKRLFLLLLILFILVSPVFGDDDDDDDKKPVKQTIRYVYDKDKIGKGAVETGTYFTGPTGKLYLFPYWAQTVPTPTVTPTPIPTPKPTPVPTVTPTPVPTIPPTKQNAFDSCIQCHRSGDSKYKFVNWKPELHQKSGHRNAQCYNCHNVLR